MYESTTKPSSHIRRSQSHADGDPVQTGTQAPTAADLAMIADDLECLLAAGEPQKAKALIRELIAELRVDSKTEIQPTYYLNTTPVCATSEKVDPAGIEPATSCMPSRRRGLRRVATSCEYRRSKRPPRANVAASFGRWLTLR
jgi:hypothetical protein